MSAEDQGQDPDNETTARGSGLSPVAYEDRS